MNNYGFSVLVAGIDLAADNYEDVLFEAGCDDALVLVRDGQLILDFHRDGGTFDEAVQSATESIERAGGKVARVAPLPH